MNHKTTSERMADAMAKARQHWQQQRAGEGLAAVPPAPPTPRFTIAISREAGANGPAIARAAGAQLGWPVYDQELLRTIAEDMGVRERLLESVDEKRGNWLRECLQAFSSVPAVSESAYVRHLIETLLSLAAHGNCLVVGRGAAVVLPAETTLRVRLVGPPEQRVRAICDRFGITEEEAARWVEKTDRERAAFVKDHFQKDAADARNYDLVLNSMRFSVEQCADFIVEALRRLQARVTAAR
jgi:cytidylate kinase